jgi:hypothetical protein
MMGVIGAIWGLLGVLALLGCAVYRLAPRALEALRMDLSTVQWVVLVLWVIFMLVAEGYRGFQKKFSPRTAARIRHLRDHPRTLHVILAPLFCMGYFHALRKTRIIAFALTFGIILLVIAVKFAPQPWRGIIDAGVVMGLTYGAISLLLFTFRALSAKNFPHSPEVPSVAEKH